MLYADPPQPETHDDPEVMDTNEGHNEESIEVDNEVQLMEDVRILEGEEVELFGDSSLTSTEVTPTES